MSDIRKSEAKDSKYPCLMVSTKGRPLVGLTFRRPAEDLAVNEGEFRQSAESLHEVFVKNSTTECRITLYYARSHIE